ncbi:MAG: hypothetical protein AOA65_2351 [Candidatus Bathyarchaeota archaeon BA1]|nr:MAG: hypothetical protein AOA65_2351 [Candidatus Bathyarchaeota archaeon BA1]
MKILAAEDGRFPEGKLGERKGKALLLGVVISNFAIEKILLSHIDVDGLDATERLIEMIKKEKEGVNLIMLPSISYGGFNLMDPIQIHSQLKIPVIVVNPEKPDNIAVKSALFRHFPDWEKRLAIFEKVGIPQELSLGIRGYVYFHAFGTSKTYAERLIRKLIIFGNRPEPLRIARILAHELSKVAKNI